METTFLTVDDLKLNTSISKNVDITLLEPFITISEQMHIQPVLGTALTDQIIDQIDNSNLTTANQTLLDNYLVPCSSWFTYFEASIFLAYRSENKGIVKKSSENSQPIEARELVSFRQSINDKASFLKNKLIDFLEENKTTYPLYRSSSSSIKDNSTGIFLG